MQNKTKLTTDPRKHVLAKTYEDPTKTAKLKLNPAIIPLIHRFENFEPAFTNFLLQISITVHHTVKTFFCLITKIIP